MRLSDAARIAPLEVVRDGEFESLGLLSYDGPKLLVTLYDARFLRRELLQNPHIACVITTPELAPLMPEALGVAIAGDPKRSFYEVHEYLLRCTDFYWKDFPTEISPEARVHPGAWIAPRNVRISRGTVIEPHVTVLERTLIGEDAVIRAGSVIGADGFDPKQFGGVIRMTSHAGGVAIHDRVEIQANCVVCRGVFGALTRIEEDTKVSSLVNISHHVRIGRRCRIGAGACVLGSARIGDNVWIGPNATVSNQVRIGDGASISLGSVVVMDVEAGQTVSGNFAVDHKQFLAFFRRILK
ncbi:MAG: UDP-3-O-(3-hydroxymyristoyl)glucosamine N-acyltransferase [Bryobacterales bacterium]|nr:UDP-3-O-(3-hydroxymyristoyl)glucosamine N-acyltransferase [Bryobacterales bacterium]